MGILDQFQPEDASGDYVAGIYLKGPFDLISKGFTPETPRRATPFWRIHGGNPAKGGIELL